MSQKVFLADAWKC